MHTENFREVAPFRTVCSIFGWIEIHALYTISAPFDCLHELLRGLCHIGLVGPAPTDWIGTDHSIQGLCMRDESRRRKCIRHLPLRLSLFYKRQQQCSRVPTSSCTAPMDVWIRLPSLGVWREFDDTLWFGKEDSGARVAIYERADSNIVETADLWCTGRNLVKGWTYLLFVALGYKQKCLDMSYCRGMLRRANITTKKRPVWTPRPKMVGHPCVDKVPV